MVMRLSSWAPTRLAIKNKSKMSAVRPGLSIAPPWILNSPRFHAEGFQMCRLEVDYYSRHTGESRYPGFVNKPHHSWMPAFIGMTKLHYARRMPSTERLYRNSLGALRHALRALIST